MSAARITTDHEKIQQWARRRGGKPAEVKGTEGLEQLESGYAVREEKKLAAIA